MGILYFCYAYSAFVCANFIVRRIGVKEAILSQNLCILGPGKMKSASYVKGWSQVGFNPSTDIIIFFIKSINLKIKN